MYEKHYKNLHFQAFYIKTFLATSVPFSQAATQLVTLRQGPFFLDLIKTKCPVHGFKDSLNFPHLAGNIGKTDLMAMS